MTESLLPYFSAIFSGFFISFFLFFFTNPTPELSAASFLFMSYLPVVFLWFAHESVQIWENTLYLQAVAAFEGRRVFFPPPISFSLICFASSSKMIFDGQGRLDVTGAAVIFWPGKFLRKNKEGRTEQKGKKMRYLNPTGLSLKMHPRTLL